MKNIGCDSIRKVGIRSNHPTCASVVRLSRGRLTPAFCTNGANAMTNSPQANWFDFGHIAYIQMLAAVLENNFRFNDSFIIRQN